MTVQSPIPDYAAARSAMVDSQLRPQGVTDRAVLAAMGSVAREDFVPSEVRPLAYVDRSLSLGGGRFLPPPAFLGQLLTQMAPAPGERALVVGAGTGYSAAVLAHIGCEVTARSKTSRSWPRQGRRRSSVLRPHPDRRRRRIYSGIVHRAACRRRAGLGRRLLSVEFRA